MRKAECGNENIIVRQRTARYHSRANPLKTHFQFNRDVHRRRPKIRRRTEKILNRSDAFAGPSRRHRERKGRKERRHPPRLLSPPNIETAETRKRRPSREDGRVRHRSSRRRGPRRGRRNRRHFSDRHRDGDKRRRTKLLIHRPVNSLLLRGRRSLDEKD